VTCEHGEKTIKILWARQPGSALKRPIRRAFSGQCCRKDAGGSPQQRIDHVERRKSAEIAVRRPEFAYAMLNTEGSHARIVHAGAHDLTGAQERAQADPVLVGLGEQNDRRRLQPRVDLLDCGGQGCRRIVDARMGGDGEEFMQTGPRDGPRRTSFSEFRDATRGARVKRRISPVRVNENVGVERDQEPRPS
jgi:hypothetical protein